MTHARPRSVAVVGGGLAGWRVATELRRLGFEGAVTVVSAEAEAPYDRPPLSKDYLADGTARVTLAGADDPASRQIDLRRGTCVAEVEPGRVVLAGGGTIEADEVVVATGSRAARPPLIAGAPDVVTLRSRADADSLRERLVHGAEVLVLGGGFVGGEVASTAADRGCRVTLVEAQAELLDGVLGPEVGAEIRRRHEARGVRVLCGKPVMSVRSSADGVEVELADGVELTGGVAVAGLGAVLNLEVLAHLGLSTEGGVVCDSVGRVEGVAGLWAAGDVARWWDPLAGRYVRREHWSSAADQASLVAHAICGVEAPAFLRRAPYFWSDQAGTKVQVVGWPELADETGWLDVPDQPDRTVYAYRLSGDLVGITIVGAPRLLNSYRPQVEATPAALWQGRKLNHE